jgi:hypothetical protein
MTGWQGLGVQRRSKRIGGANVVGSEGFVSSFGSFGGGPSGANGALLFGDFVHASFQINRRTEHSGHSVLLPLLSGIAAGDDRQVLTAVEPFDRPSENACVSRAASTSVV